jgi:hypothetical protein
MAENMAAAYGVNGGVMKIIGARKAYRRNNISSMASPKKSGSGSRQIAA